MAHGHLGWQQRQHRQCIFMFCTYHAWYQMVRDQLVAIWYVWASVQFSGFILYENPKLKL